MKIKKILNNNAVVVTENNKEKIAIGMGIAFQKKRNDIVNPSKIEKLFVMKENEKLQQLLLQIPEKHFEISEEIITYAEEYLGTKLNDHIHIGLTDHLSFAIERVRDGINLKNKLFHEIKILYKKEFDIGMWAIKHIEKRTNLKMHVDEAAYIAIHIHTAKLQGGEMKQTLRQTAIISNIIQVIKEFLKIDIDEDELSYQRLVTHLRYAVSRISNGKFQSIDDEMLKMFITKFPIAYKCAKKVALDLLQTYAIQLPEHELGYLTLHIERLRKH
ncbi:PRD domain-containing protein [Bacillus sp. AFS053548]|uniref:PRD domain-containing protein n=1 Tax=Bacillus sp. AFS053548 TaxID=2033505 RepID=UPI000BFE1413|nr:PRD domain-containing protein [Bacillus sp. AFS053548]PGM56968.1 levansucrase [Bacillus sp. AFS053548]